MSKTKGLKSWSFSTHQNVERCPAKVKYVKLDGIPDPAGPAAARGTIVHDDFEKYVLYEGTPFPKAYRRWQPGLDKLINECDDVKGELEFAFDRDWKKTTWRQGTLRGKIDLVTVLGDTVTVVDYKTGKPYPEHKDQLELYALAIFLLYPWCEDVRAADWYLDQDFDVEYTDFNRDQHYANLLNRWVDIGESLLTRKEWPAKRNRFCKYCPASSRVGGPCLKG